MTETTSSVLVICALLIIEFVWTAIYEYRLRKRMRELEKRIRELNGEGYKCFVSIETDLRKEPNNE